MTVTITGTNDVPLLTTSQPTPVIISNPRLPGEVPLAPDLQLSDLEGRLVGASVTLHDAASSDVLKWTLPARSGISVDSKWIPASTDVAASRVLSFSGIATPEIYQELLNSISYTSSSPTPWRRDPAIVATSRSNIQLTWMLDDGFANPVTATSSLRFVNLKPEIAPGTVYLVGTTNPLPVDADLQFSDPDSTQLASALVRIENRQVGDLLSWDTDIASLKGLQATFSEPTGELTITGVATVIDYQSLLRSVAFAVDWSQTSNPAAFSTSRSIAWQVVDANDDVRGPSTSDLYRSTIHLSAISSGPGSSLSATGTTQEDNGAVSTTGPLTVLPALPLFSTATKILTLNGQLAINDPDFDQNRFSTEVSDWPALAETNIGKLEITTSGSWTYTLDNTHPYIQALQAGEQRIESFMVHSLDGTARQRVDITINGSDDIISQYASEVLRASSQGKDPASDLAKRWYASQALGAPNSAFGDIETAWSPRRRNSDGFNGSGFDEFIELGFSRSVQATGVRIHETAGFGFVREVWGIVDTPDVNGNKRYESLWSGVDNADADSLNPGVLELNFAPTKDLINGLLILVDIDQSSFWEQIDAVELIGIAQSKTWIPQKPVIDEIEGDNVINLAEKTAGVIISGTYDPYGTTSVELSWGGKTHSAELNTVQGSWQITVEAADVPADAVSSTLEVRAFDRSDSRSGDRFVSPAAIATVAIDSVAPLQPTLAVVAGDNIVNSYEKYVQGVILSGSAEPLSQVEIAWDYKLPRLVQVDASGNWSLEYTSVRIPLDAVDSQIVVTAIDSSGNRSVQLERDILIDTMAPTKVLIDSINWSDTINILQKASGVRVTGSAEPGANVDVSWLQSDGSFIIRSTSAASSGVYGVAASEAIVTLLYGTEIFGTVQSGKSGEFLYILSPENINLLSQLGSTIASFTALWIDANGRQLSKKFPMVKGLWQATFSTEEVPVDGANTRIEAIATDPQGNVSRIKTDFVLVDTQAPSTPVLKELDTRLNASDLLDTLLVKGSAEVGSNLVLTLLGESSTARAGSGSWTAQFTPQQLARIRTGAVAGGGIGTLSIQVFDPVGNGSELLSQSIEIDAAPPITPTFNLSSGSYVTSADRLGGFTFSGSSEVGSTIAITWETIIRTAVTDETGAWSIRFLPTEIPSDTPSSLVMAVASDAVGNRSEAAELSLVIDTVAPIPLITLLGAGDGILSTQNGHQQIRGSGEPMKALTLWVSGGTRQEPMLLASINTDARGLFSLALSAEQLQSIGEGSTHTIFVSQSDAAGNSSVSPVFPFSVDLTAPEITVSNLGGSDRIISSVSGDAAVMGTADPDQPLTFSAIGPLGTRTLGVITPDKNGSFSITLSAADLAALGQGSDFNLRLQQSDQAGNTRTHITAFAIDTIAPAAPLITLLGGSDETISSALLDNQIEGLAESNSSVSLMLSNGNGLNSLFGTTTANTSGKFFISLSNADLAKLPQGSGFQVSAIIQDQAGNTAVSTPVKLSVDTIAPQSPLITSVGGSDNVVTSVAGDQSISGSAIPYSTVSLNSEIDGSTFNLGSATANGKGLFSYVFSSSNLTSLGQGLRRFWAVISDLAGNQASSIDVLATVDTQADSAPTITSVGGSDRIISTSTGDQAITGSAEVGRPVSLKAFIPANGKSSSITLDLGTIMPNADGKLMATLSSRNLQDLLQDTAVQLYFSQPDKIGNVGVSEPFVFTIDTELPDVPVVRSVGGTDSVITALDDAKVVGKSTARSVVTLLASDDGITYNLLDSIYPDINGDFIYSFSQAQIDGMSQGPGSLLIAEISDTAGNKARSYPFGFSLFTLPPASPVFSGIIGSGSEAFLKLDATSFQTGLKVSGTADGATSVELMIGSKTVTPLAFVDSNGTWSVNLASDQLPASKISSTTTVQAVAYGPYGAVSEKAETSLRYDTYAPTILNVVNEGHQVRVIFDELVEVPVSAAASKLSLRSGSRTVGIKNVQSLNNSLGNTELVLDLSETLPVNTVVKLSYLGSGIRDLFGNKLSQFNNRIVTDLALSNSISEPGYAYVNLSLTGNESNEVLGNSYANTIVGNSSDNILEGGVGTDILTGGAGRDTFVYRSTRDSVLIDPVTGKSSVDKITDFAIGTDVIDGPYSVSSNSVLRLESVDFSAEVLQSLLPANILQPGGAAILTFTSSQQTYVLLNDATPGYGPSEDILIDISGYKGLSGNLNII